MTERDQEEQDLRIVLTEAQMQKIAFDIESFKAEQKARAENWQAENRIREKQLTRQTWAIILSAIGLVVGAFAAGAAWWNYFHVIH
jgi:ABC-type lipoprotein release transport system permease subunit